MSLMDYASHVRLGIDDCSEHFGFWIDELSKSMQSIVENDIFKHE